MKLINSRIIKKLFILGMFLCLNFLVYADNGQSGAVFLKIDNDARTSGLGGIGVINKAGNINLEVNPATINYILKYPSRVNRIAKLSHNELVSNIKGEYAQYTQNIGSKISIGGYLKYISVSDMVRTDIYGYEQGLFGNYYSSLGLVLGLNHGKFSYGATVKRVEETINKESGSSIVGDFGFIYDVNDKIDLGASVLNVGKAIKVFDNESSLPFTYNIGGSYFIVDNLLFLAAVEKEVNLYMEGKVGLEWSPYHLFQLRTGYSVLGYDQLSKGASFGFTFKYQNLKLDYSYLPFDKVESLHKITMSIYLGND